MKAFKKLLAGVTTLSLALSFIGPVPQASAALAPGFLGAAESFSVFGNAGIIGGAASTVWGDAGENGFGDGSVSGQQAGTYYPAANPGVVGAISSAYGDLAAEVPTGIVDLSTPTSVGPGVYTVTSSTFNQTLTLTGAGTYVFQRASDIAQTAGGTMVLDGGACASNVYWRTGTGMTFAAVGNIEGTIIAGSAISFANSALTLKGRALAQTSVDLGGITITEPVCAVPPSAPGSTPNTGTINVVKNVINDNGGTNVVADFPLFVNGTPVISGQTNTFPTTGGIYHVSETNNAGYTQVFSGDCDVNGDMNLNPGNNKFCILTNDDIGAPIVVPPVPPLIDVVKVPSPLSLPAGPGSVLYTYTTRNIGTVPMSNVTMVGDSCSPLVRISGDINNNAILEVSETWVYTCTTTLTETHTNTVVATGWANGLSAVDIASATVVVGQSIVPPLIHITKTPSPLTLGVGGGSVTYTKRVTNPGTVALSNVQVTDDKCSPLTYVSGDTNNNSMLESTETWTYRCTTNIIRTTTNTAVATGVANGLTARDLAVATVVVATAVPALPNTGVAPLATVVAGGLLAIALIVYAAYAIRKRQKISGR